MKRLGLTLIIFFSSGSWGSFSCDPLLSNVIQNEEQALHLLRGALDRLGGDGLARHPWYRLIQTFSLPNAAQNTPLLVTSIIGGGNAGKSTLFNALPYLISGQPSKPISKTGYFPGLTKRMVISIARKSPEWVTADLRERFGAIVPWRSMEESGTRGPGLISEDPAIPENLAFIDSPDFDTGSFRDDEPENIRRAMEVVCPSDVLALMVDIKTVRNLANIKLLHRIFEHYGQKRTILILVGDSSMEHDEARSLLHGLANALYDSEGSGTPTAVLASYLLPYSSEIVTGVGQPSLIPLEGSRTFDELVRYMNDRSTEIKQFSNRNALTAIMTGAEEYLRGLQRERLAAQLYDKALAAATEVASFESVQNFNYMAVRDLVQPQFRALANQFEKFTYSLGKLSAVPDQLLISFFKQARLNGTLNQELQEKHGAHDRLAVSQFLLYLRNERLPVRELAALRDGRRLIQMHERYANLFPEATRRTDDSVVLPPRTSLPSTIAAKIDAVIDGNIESLTQKLGEKINSVQFSQNGISEYEIHRMLARLHDTRSPLRQAGTGLLDALTLAAPTAAASWLVSQNINNTLVWLAVIVGSSRPFRVWSDRAVDNYLSSELNTWYRGLQKDVTIQFFTEEMTTPIHQEIHSVLRGIDDIALMQAQEALRFLHEQMGTRYAPLPLSLSE